MKKLFYLFSLIALVVSIGSCTNPTDEDGGVNPYLTLEYDTLRVSYLGTDGVEYVEVQASGEWQVLNDADWVLTSSEDNLLGVEVMPNQTDELRTTSLTIVSQELQAKFVVMQFADSTVEASRIIPADTIYVVDNNLGLLAVEVASDGEYAVSTDAGWLQWSEQSTEVATTFENFVYDAYYGEYPRYATVTFESENTSASIKVMQWGSDKLLVDKKSMSFFFAKVEPQTITVTAAGDYEISVDADWVNYEVVEGVLDDQLLVTVANNTVTEERKATMTITAGEITKTITISQEALKDYKDFSSLAAPGDRRIRIQSAEATSTYMDLNSYTPDKSYDNTAGTGWRNDENTDYSPAIGYWLDTSNGEQLDYFEYTPFTIYGTGGYWGEVEVYVTDSNNKTRKVETIDFGMSDQPSVHYFKEPLTDVKYIQFNIITGSKSQYAGPSGEYLTYASVGEIAFFQKAIHEDPLTVFADWSLSELKEGVTMEQIRELRSPFYRSIAEQIFYGVYDGEFRICKFRAYPHPDRDAAIFRTNTYTLLDNVTGMYVANAGDTIRIYLNDTHNQQVAVRVVDWVNEEAAATTTSTKYNYTLKEGYNEIIPSTRGLMYMICHTDDYASVPEMTAHFVNAKVNGYIELGKTDMKRAYELLRKGGYTEPHFDMLSKRALLNFPKNNYYENTFLRNPENTDRVEELLHVYDTIMYIQEEIQGHYKYKALGRQRVHRNRALYRGTYNDGFYGASAGYATIYHVNNIGKEVCNPSRMWNKSATTIDRDVIGPMWGLVHELGHTNQTEMFKWRGLTEVTNNLMCAITQMIFYGEGNTTMRFNDHFNRGMRDYVTRWVVDPDGTRRRMTHCEGVNTPSLGGTEGGVDPTTQLMPFWQLYLYYHIVVGNTDFYPDFYEACRLSDGTLENDEGHIQAMINFVKMASDAAGEDLSQFCEAWGLPGVNNRLKATHYGTNYITTTEADIAAIRDYCKKYDKPKLDPLYINDLNLDLYRTPKAVVAGTHSVDAAGNYSTEGWENVVAWGLKEPASGEVVGICQNDKQFNFGIVKSIYSNDGNGNYLWTSNGNNRYMESASPEYRTDLQLFGIAADGTWVASKSN